MKKHFIIHYTKKIISIFIFSLILFALPQYLYPETIPEEYTPIYEAADLRAGGNIALYDDYIDIEASNAILMDAVSGNILWGKNIMQPVYPASITKIMTGILAIENIKDFDEIIEISENASGVNNSAFSLNRGDKISLMDLLKAALISSHNNATIALAEYISGNTDDFVDMMNDKAIEIGAYNTNFENTNGLDSKYPEHKTTAYDVALMSRYAMNNELFRKIVGTYTENILLNNEELPIVNTNKLINYDYIKGIKTGYTENAGFCLATFSDLNGLELITVILNSGADTRERDALKLIYWADNNIKTVKLVDSQIPIDTIVLGTDTQVSVDIYPAEDIPRMIHLINNHIEVSHTLFSGEVLPLDTDRSLGTVFVSINGQNIGSADLVSKVSIDGPHIVQNISGNPRRQKIILIAVILSFYFLLIIFIIFKNLLIKRVKY